MAARGLGFIKFTLNSLDIVAWGSQGFASACNSISLDPSSLFKDPQ